MSAYCFDARDPSLFSPYIAPGADLGDVVVSEEKNPTVG